jgi:DNA-binding XRE family transcriptional regulator
LTILKLSQLKIDLTDEKEVSMNEHPILMARTNLGLKQTELAHILDVSKQAVSSWEKGKQMPSRKHLQMLAKLFGITIDHLLVQIASESDD